MIKILASFTRSQLGILFNLRYLLFILRVTFELSLLVPQLSVTKIVLVKWLDGMHHLLSHLFLLILILYFYLIATRQNVCSLSCRMNYNNLIFIFQIVPIISFFIRPLQQLFKWSIFLWFSLVLLSYWSYLRIRLLMVC